MTIDWWTLGFQAVNVAILIWILARFFWRPLSAMIEQRREAANRMLAEAEAKRGEAEAAVAEAVKARAGFAAEREAILAAAGATAEQESATRRAEADRQAGEIEAAARAAMAAERQAAERAFAERAARLSLEIAGRLAGRLDAAAVRAAFLDGFVAAIRALPDEKRGDAASGGNLEVVSAAPLPPDEQAAAQRRIAEAFGGGVEVGFAVDPALVAGLELRGAHLIVANNWRADLDRLKTEIDDVG
ncbi:MAG: F0F1 ATP synthase subunit delta [Roseiarcus sp.]|jgi:F-type H+-transporting ATPase subunit b